ncbi:MAG TPA: hypothetical protein VOA87_09880 [Thermoanaerobaculia bacterium]|nr:hypothetical protein [Thermoanaerobaculia bacterium]
MSLITGLSLQKMSVVTPSGPGHAALLESFKIHRQDQDLWCWVAVAASINEFYTGQLPKQCTIARDTLTNSQVMVNNVAISTCCPWAAHPECNMAFFADLALQQLGHLAGSSPGALVFSSLDVQIPEKVPTPPVPRGHPIACSIVGTQTPGAHFVVISGWEQTADSHQCIYVDNPSGPTASFEDYDEFVHGKETSWVFTYLTQ